MRLALTTGFGSQIVWNRSNRCAGERGGARVGSPKWLRILMITGGSSMAAMIFKALPQLGQCSMSISKTRWSGGPNLTSTVGGSRSSNINILVLQVGTTFGFFNDKR